MEEEQSEIKKSKLFSWITDNYDKVFIAVLILAFIIRFLIFLKTLDQPMWWDAADYLATAKRWAGVELNNIWYYRRAFFWPLFSAIFFKTGLGETGIRFTEVLFSTGIVAVSYFLIKNMFNKKLALLVSIGLTFSWVILFFTGRPLTSIPATFFLLTALLFFWKGYVLKQGNKFIYLFGLFYGLAVLTRMQYLLFIFPFLVFIFTREKFQFLKNKHLWIALGIFVLIMLPHFIMYWMHYGFPLIDIANHYFGISAIPSQAGNVGERTFSTIFTYFKDMPYILGGQQASFILSALSNILLISFLIGVLIFFADLIFGFDKIFKNNNLQKKLFILLWISTLFLVLGYITDYIEHRYIIPALPFIFLIIAIPFIKLKKYINKKMILIFIIFLLLLIPSYQWANQLIESKKTSYLEVKQAGEWLKQNSNPGDIVLSVSLPQTMYYSERPTYPFNMASEDFRRRDPTIPEYGLDKEGFENFIKDKKPRYLIVSVFEVHPDWTQQYLNENKDNLIPVKVYNQNQQPVLIIYKFIYS